MIQHTFERYEKKFLLSGAQYRQLMAAAAGRIRGSGKVSSPSAGKSGKSASAKTSASMRFKRSPAFGKNAYFVMIGSSMMKVEPLFSSLSARISPLCNSTI